ncbi:indolepyruvate ferredoxin oxidoreductase subunit alpha [Candidatus Micrarchaeota archaeon]|nr:indolepyruvate ferredoxin oxidoreductase subunit alpha [Candidatus Micrarchaeota archaeon]
MNVLEKAGKNVVLLGNEAIARGALEAGVGVVAAYPGTPSSEVPTTLAGIAKECGFLFEYSSNEKVAFETAAGAAWSGVRSLTAMKHFGLNVASDSVSPVAYSGVKGGFVLMVADDPYGWSSAQSEQDTRYYARMMRLPVLEPSNPQECLDLTKLAFDISEEFELPFFLRTTTKVSHAIGTVKLGKIKKPKLKGKFVKDKSRYYNIRPNLQELHKQIDGKLNKIEKKYAKLNKVFKGKGNIGVIASGVSFEYAKELFHMLGINPPMAKLTLTYPTPRNFIKQFIKNKKAVLVLEELEPIVENEVKMLAKDVNPKLAVHGKALLPNYGEYNLEVMMPAFEKVFKKKCGINFAAHKKQTTVSIKGLPPRKPVLCPGCPHRSTFYAVKDVFGENAVFAGDIGCYVLGIFEPFNMQDFIVSMGASLGISHGISMVSDQEIIAFIGDSTFFHSGMSALANLKFNDHKTPLIIVMDNSFTAMTGHQPNPGTGITGVGEAVQSIKIEEVAKAMGAEVRVVNSFNQKQIKDAILELKNVTGLRVIISRGECRLVTKRKLRSKNLEFTKFEIDQSKCTKCGICTNKFACPAIKEIRKKASDEPIYYIEPDICWGCSVCMQICPYGAIHPVKKEVKE